MQYGLSYEYINQVLKRAEVEAVAYNVYISGLCRAGKLSEAIHQVDTMRKKGLHPTKGTLYMVFDCLCRDPSTIYKAKELLERSGELEWELDSFFFNTLMSRLLKWVNLLGF
ncbi:Pentatricopeptide repeat-containing protein [Carex littledalei]|uniref:Pentatricopeptide repeat-containing protein n=1 Tax=Carex littledalei TaxID=544730 RepID=A0A833RUM8_9POAL|nr:Pentatricopeptide repeat-containing protein [Carex littledalei]